MDGIDDCTLLF